MILQKMQSSEKCWVAIVDFVRLLQKLRERAGVKMRVVADKAMHKLKFESVTFFFFFPSYNKKIAMDIYMKI